MRKNNNRNIALLLVIIFIVGCIFTILYYYNYYLLDHLQVRTDVTVTEGGAAFNVNDENLSMGKTVRGGSAERSFHISNKQKSLVKVSAAGNISPYLTFSDNNFILPANEVKQIFVYFIAPENISLGKYHGVINVNFYRAK